MEEQEVSFILFGGTGDLTKRKLVPAFAKLLQDKKIRGDSTIIGISRKNWNDEEYRNFLINSVEKKEDKERIRKLDIRFLQGDFIKNGLNGLKELILKSEKPGCNRIFYLSTGFKFFPIIVQELKRYSMDKKNKGFTRIVFEKPFGKDLKSSENLDKEIHKVFSEKDVFRIDHYLAKNTVQNLNVLKFTNPVLYSSFGKDHIDSIEVNIEEDLGVGNRIEYYNDAGALKDMIQSHLLQVLSLILMEKPKSLLHDKIHDEKVKILRSLEVLPATHHLLGQYESYDSEAKAAALVPDNIETFAKIELNCKIKKWNGVKLILRTGKKLQKKTGQIRIKFKPISSTFKNNFIGLKNNEINIGIYPNQDVTIWMNTRTPEQNNEVKPVKFEFCQEYEFGPNTADEYSILIEEILKGDKTLFTRSDEVRESWKIVEKIEKMKDKINFIKYKDGTDPEINT